MTKVIYRKDSLAVTYKKLLSKGDSLLSAIMTVPQKAVTVFESTDIIESFINQVEEVKEHETYLTFDPIYGIF